MIDTSIRMTVPAGKRTEILQTLKAILGRVRREPGCISCHCYVDIESENKFYFVEEWETSAELETHLKSVHFGVLIGAMKLLEQEPEIRFSTVASTAGVEAVDRARS